MNKEKDFFIENISLLLKANMPVGDAIAAVKKEIRSKKLVKMISIMEAEIENGSNISDAFEKAKVLPKRFISLLRIGENTGELSNQLTLIVSDEKKDQSFRSKIRSALIYPAFVVVITLSVSIVTIWYTFPKLLAVFSSIGGELPLTTRIIISIGNFFRDYGIIAVPASIISIILLFLILFVFTKTKIAGEKILMFLPLTKTMIQEIELARFGYGMSTLLRSGISIPQALDSIAESSPFITYKRFYAGVISKVIDGNSLYKSITLYPKYEKLIPAYIAQLFLAGEMSGSLADTMKIVSDSYEEKLDSLTKDLSALLEPVIVVVVGIVVALIVFGIISPIYGLVNQIN